MNLLHVRCDQCGHALICPWDRFCAGCGRSLVRNEQAGGGFLISHPDSVKVGGDDRVSLRFENRSKVVVTVKVPALKDQSPPKWLKATDEDNVFELGPQSRKEVTFQVDRQHIEKMLIDHSLDVATLFELPVYVDADYRNQRRRIVFSLLGQADLSPAAIEFPSIWLTVPHRIKLPFALRSTSGEDMNIEQVRVFCPNAEDAPVVENLFPENLWSRFRGKKLTGEGLEMAIESEPVAETLRQVTDEHGWRFTDPYEARRRVSQSNLGPEERAIAWIEKWPPLTRIRFVVEATFRMSGTTPVPPVRSLVVLTLVRPPLLRDATPEDDLWKPVGNVQVVDGLFVVGEDGKVELVADLSNDSAMPVQVLGVKSDRKWISAPTALGKVLNPGKSTEIRVKVDLNLREPDELVHQRLKANIWVETQPRTPLRDLEPIQIQARSTVELPGALGIDFGTSNCAVCYMPAGEPPEEGSSLDRDPVHLPIESSDSKDLPSILVRLRDDPARPQSEFEFGTNAQGLEQAFPANTVRGIKRLLGKEIDRKFNFIAGTGANAIKTYTTRDLADRMLQHITRRIQELAPSDTHLRERLTYAAENASGDHPPRNAIDQAVSFRFRKAVFTHPVNAEEPLKRVLYDCAASVGLARGTDGQLLPFEQFERECLIDESSAAIGHFVYRRRMELRRRRVRNIVCVDIGGGTTDISAVELDLSNADGPSISLACRKGESFAGLDYDRAIVGYMLAKKVDPGLAEGATTEKEIILDWILQNRVTESIEAKIRQKFPGIDREAMGKVLEGLLRASIDLRSAAEEVKKKCSVDPSGSTPVTVKAYLPILTQNGYESLEDDRSIILPHAEVNELIQRLTRERIAPVLDEVITKTLWGWDQVQLVMLTGQTCRSTAVRDCLLEHVRNRAPGPQTPLLVVPPPVAANTTAPVQWNFTFDPKLCVPAGAALRGVGLNKVQFVRGAEVPFKVKTDDGPLIKKGQRAPALTFSGVYRDKALGDCIKITLDDHREVRHAVPTSIDAGLFTIVIDEASRIWVIHTAPAGAERAAAVPESVASVIASIPASQHEQLGMQGPVVAWCEEVRLQEGAQP